MVWASSIRIVVLLLAVAILWRLIGGCFLSRRGTQVASVWSFLGQVVFVLGALLVTGIVFTGLSLGPPPTTQEILGKPDPIRAVVERKIPFQSDVQVPIDKLWDQLSQPAIVLSSEPVEIVVSEKKVLSDQIESISDQESDAPGRREESETQEMRIDSLENSGKTAVERPDWVVHPPKRVGYTYRRVIVSGPFQSVDECHQELKEKLRLAVYQRMAADGADDPVYQDFTFAKYKALGIGTDYIYREICRDEYVESWQASFGPMVQVHLKLEFNPSTEQHLRDVWRQYQARQRLGTVASLASAGMLLLGFTYGLLKFDTWTRGYYSKRLLLGVPAVIISLILLWLVG